MFPDDFFFCSVVHPVVHLLPVCAGVFISDGVLSRLVVCVVGSE